MSTTVRPAIKTPLDPTFGTWRGFVRWALAEGETYAGLLGQFTRVDWSKVDRLVFVCLGNICRSPLGEAVAKVEGLPTASIGLSTSTGAPADEMGRRVATRLGYDLESHQALDFSDYQWRPGDLLLMMEIRHARDLRARLAAAPAAQIAMLGAWSRPRRVHIHDPLDLGEAYFHSCYRVIESAVVNLAADWRSHGGPAAGAV